jgi:hypothetical protein
MKTFCFQQYFCEAMCNLSLGIVDSFRIYSVNVHVIILKAYYWKIQKLKP